MKRYLFLIAVFAAVAAALTSYSTSAGPGVTTTIPVDDKAMKAAEAGTYTFDKAHSFIGFKVRHMGLIDVPGFFRDFDGSVNYDPKDVTRSSVTFTAKMTSVDTGVQGRDNHLRRADFFEVEKFPEMTFKSTKVEKKNGKWIVSGDFTMKGVTKPVQIPFEITGFLPAGERSAPKIGIAGETTINRRDFGVNYGNNLPSGIPAIGDEVKVVLQIEAQKARPTPPAAE